MVAQSLLRVFTTGSATAFMWRAGPGASDVWQPRWDGVVNAHLPAGCCQEIMTVSIAQYVVNDTLQRLVHSAPCQVLYTNLFFLGTFWKLGSLISHLCAANVSADSDDHITTLQLLWFEAMPGWTCYV
eukprot:scaffold30002_cov36-Prasinocladus_malaysianus.AAC.1